jgi:pimeloyl-ACP methyl ester carboxylesterase
MAGPASITPETPPPAGDEPTPVASSPELLAPVSPGIELCYRTFGDTTDEPMLLLMGLASPLTWWDQVFCSMLVRRGYFVITLDNRDVGRSTKVAGQVTRRMLVRAFTGVRVRAPYTMSDMAGDEPARVRSLTSIMSSTGKRSVGWQHPRLFPALLRPLRPGREAYAESGVAMWRLIGSPGYPRSDQDTRQLAYETFDRGICPSGTLRQMMAILTQLDRSKRLHDVRVPTLVVHGLADKMVHVSGGRATAAAIAGAELLLVDGMGHDLPPELFTTLVDAIDRTASRA